MKNIKYLLLLTLVAGLNAAVANDPAASCEKHGFELGS